METPEKLPNGAMPITPDDEELKKLYQEYLQKCCEVGQLGYQLEQLDGQKRELEKNMELAQRAAKSAAHKHKELQTKKLTKIKAVDPIKLDMKPDVPGQAH